MKKKLLSLKRLSQKTGISVTTLRKYLRQGMPHYRPEKKIFVSYDEFWQWFEENFRQGIGGDGGGDDLDAIISKSIKRHVKRK